jgi:hypothetical protein
MNGERPTKLIPNLPSTFKVVGERCYGNSTWPFWTRWGWCKVSDVLELINREYKLRLKKRDLLTRFSYVQRDLQGKKAGATRPAFAVLRTGPSGLRFTEYKPELLTVLERANEDFFVPAGWAKDVLWALYGGADHFEVQGESGGNVLVACRYGDPSCDYIV